MASLIPKKVKEFGRKEFLVALFIIVIGLFLIWLVNTSDPKTVVIDDSTFKVEVADDPAERRQGLSGRSGLGDDEGMLFVFEDPAMHSFWMKDMKFSIDMVWIDQDGGVVHVENQVSPNSYPMTFSPSTDALYVLEVASGQAEATGLIVGASVDINLQ